MFGLDPINLSRSRDRMAPPCWRCCALAGFLVLAVAGCAADDAMLRKALIANAATHAPASQFYQVGCADVLELEIPGRAEWSGACVVHANGCIDLKGVGGVRVDGLNAEEIRAEIVGLARLDKEEVEVKIGQFASQQVYLFGDNPGEQRAFLYEGPETVVDFLRRVGVAETAVPETIYVVRDHLSDERENRRMEVDLKAILLDGDKRSNVILQPYDRIYIEETDKSRLGKLWRRAWPRLSRTWRSLRGMENPQSTPPTNQPLSRGFITPSPPPAHRQAAAFGRIPPILNGHSGE